MRIPTNGIAAAAPFSRAEFALQVARGRSAEQAAGRWLAALSVGLGVAQLIFIRWATSRIEAQLTTTIAGVAFLAYLAIVAIAFARMLRGRAMRPTCPHCRRAFDDTSVRIVTASGRCDGCGDVVVAQ